MTAAIQLILITALVLPVSSSAQSLLAQASDLIKAGEEQQALALFTRAAENGDPVGEYGLGVLYFQGTAVDRDIPRSTRHFRTAAERGHVPAQYNLGNAYLHGRGLKQSLDQAEHWWRKASITGYVRAQYNLGVLLFENAKATALREEGLAWLRASAERGFPKSFEKLKELDEPLEWEHNQNDYQHSLLRSEARLLTLPPDSYSIQLFSGRHRASAEDFIDRHLLQDQALRFRFLHGDEIWIGLLYGLYPEMAPANDKVASLKESMPSIAPWARKLADVQASIRAVWRQKMATAENVEPQGHGDP